MRRPAAKLGAMPSTLSGLVLILATAGCLQSPESSASTTGKATTGSSGMMESTSGMVCRKSSDGGSTTGAVVSTFAGNGMLGHSDGTSGPTGTGEFVQPFGVAIDLSGNLYVADTGYGRICKVDSSGNIVTIAGGAIDSSAFTQPFAVAVDRSGNVYVADTGNNRIRVVAPGGKVTTLAGAPGQGAAGVLFGPFGLTVDGTDNVYVADSEHNRIARIDPSGNVTTFAGNGQPGDADGSGGANGSAQFNGPGDVALDSAGNLFVADTMSNRIRKVDPSGNVTTLAGNGMAADADGTGGRNGTAQLFQPAYVTVDACGYVYVSESATNRVRRIDPSGNVTTLAGNGTKGFAEGSGGLNGLAEFDEPGGMAIDDSGNVYVADSLNSRIRKITL